MNIIDISHSISNETWAYKPEWRNKVSTIRSTFNGDNSTVYRFELYSHSGTYIETSQHKLKSDVLLENFAPNRFICRVKLIKLDIFSKKITLSNFLNQLKIGQIEINENDELIVCTGWASIDNTHQQFISDAPYFEEALTEYLISKKLNLLGVDTPVIDNQAQPYDAVKKLFLNHDNLLLLAPLLILPNRVKTGTYLLNALPLKISGVSASLCRPILIDLW